MDRIDELAVFVGIVDAGSLAEAGRRMNRSPAAVTRILNGLEQRLGVRLIERTTRRLAPTDAGERLLEHARRLLSDFDEAMEDTAGEARSPRGRIRLAAPLLFGRLHMAPIVRDFLDAFPDVTAELSLSDRIVDLVEERIDVALRIGHLAPSSLVQRRVGSVRRVVVASPGYLALHGTPEAPADLSSHDAILFARLTSGGMLRLGDEVHGEHVVALSGRFQVDHAEAALDAARAGRGIFSTFSYQVDADVGAGRLVRLLRAFEPPPIPVQLVLASTRLMLPRVRAFMDFAVPRLGAIPSLQDG